MKKVMQTDFPRMTLEEALSVPRALYQEYAGDPTAPHDVAIAVGNSPTSSVWRVLSGAANGYGLTDGAYSAETISLTDLGRHIVAPTAEGEKERGLLKAALQPTILKEFFEKYDRANLPSPEILRNVLVKMGIPQDRVDEAAEIIRANGQFAGILRDTGNRLFVALDLPPDGTGANSTPPASDSTGTEIDSTEESVGAAGTGGSPTEDTSDRDRGPKPIFIGHGHNHGPLDSVKDFLAEYGVPFRIAVEEANRARPISVKVKEAMRECGSAIMIFTKDEECFDEDGNSVWRPSMNVVQELGAALYAYDDHVVIFVEKGLELPVNFRDLGHIPFDPDHFEATTAELLKELVALKILAITPRSA